MVARSVVTAGREAWSHAARACERNVRPGRMGALAVSVRAPVSNQSRPKSPPPLSCWGFGAVRRPAVARESSSASKKFDLNADLVCSLLELQRRVVKVETWNACSAQISHVLLSIHCAVSKQEPDASGDIVLSKAIVDLIEELRRKNIDLLPDAPSLVAGGKVASKKALLTRVNFAIHEMQRDATDTVTEMQTLIGRMQQLMTDTLQQGGCCERGR